MGIYGRDYMRDGKEPGFRLGGLTVTVRLIIVNAILWFLYAGSLSWGGPDDGLFRFIYEWLLIHPDEVFAKFRLWQPFTAIWFHDPDGIEHVGLNMLVLFFFGRHVEMLLGPTAYLRLYLAAGVVGSLAYALLGIATGNAMPALGASGAVYGVCVFLALSRPNLPVYLFFVLRMPLWVLVGVFMVGREILNLVVFQHTLDGTIAHLAGAAIGLLFYRLPRLGRPGEEGFAARWRRATDAKRAARNEASEQEVRSRVDALLEKIHREGIGALTKAEKDELESASRRFPR